MNQLTAVCFFLFLISWTSLVVGHTWIDCIDTDRTIVYDLSHRYIFGGRNARGACKGHGRQYPGRVPTVNEDYTYKLSRKEVTAGVNVCQFQSGGYGKALPMITIRPEETIYYSYLPNGHIAKDQSGPGTPANLYWSGKAGVDLKSTKEISPETQLGGFHDFDDGNCGETMGGPYSNETSGRAGDYKPCVSSFQIPKGTPPGVYQIVWFWQHYRDYPTPFDNAYTTCFDVKVTNGDTSSASEDKEDKRKSEEEDKEKERSAAESIKEDARAFLRTLNSNNADTKSVLDALVSVVRKYLRNLPDEEEGDASERFRGILDNELE